MCSGKGESNIQKQVLRLPHLALILKNKSIFKDKNVGLIMSGGNIDLNNLPWKS